MVYGFVLMLFFLVLAFVFVPEKTFHRKTTRFFAELYRKFKNKDQKVNIRRKKKVSFQNISAHSLENMKNKSILNVTHMSYSYNFTLFSFSLSEPLTLKFIW